MPIVIKHPFVSPLADSGSSTEVKPSDWNASHGIEMGDNFVIGRSAGGTGPAEEIPCNSDGRSILNISSLAHGDIIFRGASGFQRLAAGVAGQSLTTQGAGANPTWVTSSNSSVTLGTAVNTTSGTAIDWLPIPAGANLVMLSYAGLSTSGTDQIIVQLGTASGIETTGYLGASTELTTTPTSQNFTTGIGISGANAANIRHGVLTFVRLTGNTWAAFGVSSLSNAAWSILSSGSKSLSGPINRLRLTTAGGTNTLDAGQANISWST